jgi:nucleoside-diphosphate-sugar epimerase
MIVGNGMIANAFLKYSIDNNTIIFASGVSNSGETRESQFNREFELLKQFNVNKNHIIYFSTTSIYDNTLKETSYIKHKNKVEDYIKENSYSYNIFRLPIVVGNTNNSYTLIKFLYQKIINGDTIEVFSNACRSILDVDDLSFIVNQILKLGAFKNDILDIHLSPKANILEIIESLETSIGIKANKKVLDRGNCYEIKDDRLKNFLNQIDYKIEQDYIFKTINKYYK